MKKVYILSTNHMDPIWRRCFEDHAIYNGKVIRPYADIEEELFEQWINFMEKTGFKYSVEQSLTIKKYMERNPDKEDVFRELLQKGQIELLGGGETVIDYNMVHGESIVRNHLYSILWYRNHFNYTPQVGIAPDTFGLSAQMPQIYRKLGYPSLVRYNRVFQGANPFWKGLDGSLIYIKENFIDQGVDYKIQMDIVKNAVCSNCSGQGCTICNYTGIDYSYKFYTFEDKLEKAFKEIKNADGDKFFLLFYSEETLIEDNLPEQINAFIEDTDYDIQFIGHQDMLEIFAGKCLKQLESGEIDESQIDKRIEGNPVFTGCYVSRIELKKINRRLEDLLLSSEKFAVFASAYGMTYPRKKLEYLWNKAALFQFHDCITGTHLDAGYEELMKIGRDIQKGAADIYYEAMDTIAEVVNVPDIGTDGSFIVFNPLNWSVNQEIYETVIRLDKSQVFSGISIRDNRGVLQEILDYKVIENRGDIAVSVKFKSSEIPALGYRLFYYNLEGESLELLEEKEQSFIDNEFYKIELSTKGIRSIYDKEIDKPVFMKGTGNIVVEEDYGSPWGTLAEPGFSEQIAEPFFQESVVKRDSTVAYKVYSDSNQQKVVIKGKYSYPARGIESVSWQQEISLYRGIKKVFFKTDIDWQSSDSRLMTAFPLNFRPKDKAFFEIPYGVLQRNINRCSEDIPREGFNEKGNTEDWPALNFAAFYNQENDYIVSIINKGLPSYRIKNGVVYLSLIRSSSIPGCSFDTNMIQDQGKHSFEYILSSGSGDLKDCNVVRKGIESNTVFLSCTVSSHQGELPASYSFLDNSNGNIIISSIKRSENDNDIVLRAYETYGEKVEDSLLGVDGKNLLESNLLEENSEDIDKIVFSPFEIKTLILKGDSSITLL